MANTPSRADVTGMLDAMRGGDTKAFQQLFTLVYESLYERAQWQRRGWHGDLTLNTTALVHEAYLKLVGQKENGWESRSHFLSVAAKAMRHVLVDYARRRQAGKRNVPKVSLEAMTDDVGALPLEAGRLEQLLDLDRALTRLAEESPREARVVECRFFGGMSVPETASALGVGERTVKRDWQMACAWLFRALEA